jgi:HlyD family secretion protein
MLLNKKVLVVASLIVVASVAGFAIYHFAFAPEPPAFRFVTVERGDIQAVVSATGTLQAVTTVSVGTQVSGQISELLVDFNDHVKKGQLLARIDPTIAQQGVSDAQANLERAQSLATQAKNDQDRNRELGAEGLIAANLVEQGGSAQKQAEAAVRSAAVALARAKQNLSFTSIYAPIDGVVVERNVNNGQTVAASLSAPQLFLIANDLSQMQILALVGESDIVRIKEGQPVKFTVQAVAGQTFTGTVQQVRLQSTTADNVVNYTVIVSLANPEGKLLPGMTARVDFQVEAAENVLKVPNAALRYRPSDEVLAQFGATPAPKESGPRSSASPGASPDASPGASPGARQRSGGDGTRTRRGEGRGEGSTPSGTLYTLDADGKLQRLRVRTGLSDGVFTEVEGRNLIEGMKVIDGILSASRVPAAAPSNPLSGGRQPQRGRGGPGGGGF